MAPAFRASPTRKCATTAQIQARRLQQLEVLAVGEAFSAGLALLLVTGIRQFRRMEKRFADVI